MSQRIPTENEYKYLKKVAGYSGNNLHVKRISGKYWSAKSSGALKKTRYSHFIGGCEVLIPNHWNMTSFTRTSIEIEVCKCNRKWIALGFENRYSIDTDVTNGLLKLKSSAGYIAAIIAFIILIIYTIVFFANYDLFPSKPNVSSQKIAFVFHGYYIDSHLSDFQNIPIGLQKVRIIDGLYYNNYIINKGHAVKFYKEFKIKANYRIHEVSSLYNLRPDQMYDEKFWAKKEKIFGTDRIYQLRKKFKILDEGFDKFTITSDSDSLDLDNEKFRQVFETMAALAFYRDKIFDEFLSDEQVYLKKLFKSGLSDLQENSDSIEVINHSDYVKNIISFHVDKNIFHSKTDGFDWSKLDDVFLNESGIETIIHISENGNYIYDIYSFHEKFTNEINHYNANKIAVIVLKYILIVVILFGLYSAFIKINNYRLRKKLFNFNNLDIILKDTANRNGLKFNQGSIMWLPGISGAIENVNISTTDIKRRNIPFLRFTFSTDVKQKDTFSLVKENIVANIGKFIGIHDFEIGDTKFDDVMNISTKTPIHLCALLGRDTRKTVLAAVSCCSSFKITDTSASLEVKVSSGISLQDISNLLDSTVGMLRFFSIKTEDKELIRKNIFNDIDGVKIVNLGVFKDLLSVEEIKPFVESILITRFSSDVQIAALGLLENPDKNYLIETIINKSLHDKTILYIFDLLIAADYDIKIKQFKDIFNSGSDEVCANIIDLLKYSYSDEYERFLLQQIESCGNVVRLKIIQIFERSSSREVFDVLSKKYETVNNEKEKQVLKKTLSMIRSRLKKGREGELSFGDSEVLDGALSVDKSPDKGHLSLNSTSKKNEK